LLLKMKSLLPSQTLKHCKVPALCHGLSGSGPLLPPRCRCTWRQCGQWGTPQRCALHWQQQQPCTELRCGRLRPYPRPAPAPAPARARAASRDLCSAPAPPPWPLPCAPPSTAPTLAPCPAPALPPLLPGPRPCMHTPCCAAGALAAPAPCGAATPQYGLGRGKSLVRCDWVAHAPGCCPFMHALLGLLAARRSGGIHAPGHCPGRRGPHAGGWPTSSSCGTCWRLPCHPQVGGTKC
jgi:hypothetical protein